MHEKKVMQGGQGSRGGQRKAIRSNFGKKNEESKSAGKKETPHGKETRLPITKKKETGKETGKRRRGKKE